jgi:hypothetical protein
LISIRMTEKELDKKLGNLYLNKLKNKNI